MRRSRFPLWALAFTTIVAAGAFLVLIVSVDPTEAKAMTFVAFYASFFVAVGGIAAWAVLLARGRFASVRRPMVYFFSDAIRQGALIAAILTASLALQARGALTFPLVVGIVLAAGAIEMLFTRMSHRNLTS
jgi:hypothetical protein